MSTTVRLVRVVAGHTKTHDVLRRIDLELLPGLTHLVGPNGCGKSTLLDVIAGTLRVRQGRVDLFGHPAHSTEAWRLRSVCRAVPSLFPALTVEEHIRLLELSHGLPRGPIMARIVAYGLDPWQDTRIEDLSTGNLRKAWIILTTAVDRPIVLMDEPFSGLDTAGSEVLVHELHRWRAHGRTVVVVAHDTPQTRLTVDRTVEVGLLNPDAVS